MFIIGKVKMIQGWWKRIFFRRRQPKPSVSSSLITIKDFNETGKIDRQRNSDSKDNTPSNHKQAVLRDLIRGVIEEGSEEEEEGEEQLSLNKQVYIEHKIEGEIKSEKMFNSPRGMTSSPLARTPKSNHQMREFFSSNSASNDKNKIKERLQSPRIRSPQPPTHTTPQATFQPEPGKIRKF